MGRNSGSISIPSSRVIRGWKCNFFRGFEEGNLLLAIIKCFQHWIFRFKKRDVYKFAKERSNIPETLRSIFLWRGGSSNVYFREGKNVNARSRNENEKLSRWQSYSVEKEVLSNYDYNSFLRKMKIFHKASRKIARS